MPTFSMRRAIKAGIRARNEGRPRVYHGPKKYLASFEMGWDKEDKRLQEDEEPREQRRCLMRPGW